MKIKFVLPLIALAFFPITGKGEVKLMNIFSDHMILQKADKVPVWGWAEPGEEIIVELDGKSAKATADKDGKWQAELTGLEYGGPFEMKVKGKSGEKTVSDVMVGEVWITSGQSNMGPLGSTKNGAKYIESTNYPNLRWLPLFSSDETGEDHDNVSCHWQKAVKENPSFRHWSAVGFHFGLEIHQTLEVPVGIIHHARGGVPAESWMSMETLKSRPIYSNIIQDYEKVSAKYPALKEKYDKEMAEWQKKKEEAVKAGQREPKQPKMPKELRTQNWPSNIYRLMHEPLAPYAIKGFMFYQGESNGSRAFQYRTMLPDMIKDWRNLWHDPKKPFIIVQIATVNGTPDDGPPQDSKFAELHEAQSLTAAADPFTGICMTYDLPEPGDDIHYKHKQPAGERAGKVALGMIYGKDVPYQSPQYKSMKIENDRIRLKFDNIGSKLMAKGDKLGGFAIAGEDKKFVWANAKIEDQDVVVWHPDIKTPVAVRYAWADKPVGANLYNNFGLPAEPFRTDDWPMMTRDAK